MQTGGSSATDPLITYDLAGPSNGKAGYYHWDYHNFGPHLAFAYSPQSETVIRGGFGMVFDRIGAGLLNTFDRRGSSASQLRSLLQYPVRPRRRAWQGSIPCR